MLLKTRDDLVAARIVEHKTCVLCERMLDYPRIIFRNKYHSSFHVRCALALVVEIVTDVNMLLADKDLPLISHKLAIANLMTSTVDPHEELSEMAEAFKNAARLRSKEENA